MLRKTAVIAMILLAGCSSQANRAVERSQASAMPATAPEEGRRGIDGDTLMLFLHHVAPSKRAEYERWFAEVWEPALRAVAEKRPSARRQLMAERDLRPIEPRENGDYVYAYLYDPWVADTGAPEGSFPAGLLMEAGRSADDAKKQADVYRSLVRKDEAHMFVQKQF